MFQRSVSLGGFVHRITHCKVGGHLGMCSAFDPIVGSLGIYGIAADHCLHSATAADRPIVTSLSNNLGHNTARPKMRYRLHS
jgi:hypothetical protein